MLILTRRVGQSVVIGDEIYCTILGYREDQVRLGFDAPQNLTIHREEIHNRIVREKQFNKQTTNHETNIDGVLIEMLMAKFNKQGAQVTSH